ARRRGERRGCGFGPRPPTPRRGRAAWRERSWSRHAFLCSLWRGFVQGDRIMVSVLKNTPARLLFHANDPARLGGLAILPAILRKSPALAQQSPAHLTVPHKDRRGAPRGGARPSRLAMRVLRVVTSTRVRPDRARSMRAQGERAGGDTIISLRHRTQRALVPTISQAGSPDTMSRRHFGQVYPASD